MNWGVPSSTMALTEPGGVNSLPPSLCEAHWKNYKLLQGCFSLGFITLWFGESFMLYPAGLGSQNTPRCPHAAASRHRALGSAFPRYKPYPTFLSTLAQPSPEKPPVCCVCLLLH